MTTSNDTPNRIGDHDGAAAKPAFFHFGATARIAVEETDLTAANPWEARDVEYESGIAPSERERRGFQSRLTSFSRRMTTLAVARETVLGGFWVLVAVVVALLVDRLLVDFVAASWEAPLASIAMGLGIAVAAGMGFARKRATVLTAAIRADEVSGGRERISTALALDGEQPFELAVWRDAAWRLDRVAAREIVRWRWPWQAPVLLGLGGAIVLGLLFLPTALNLFAGEGAEDPSLTGTDPSVREMADVIRTTRKNIESLIAEEGNETTQEFLERLTEVQEGIERQLTAGTYDRETQSEDRADLSDLEDDIAEERARMDAARELSQDVADAGPDDGSDDRNDDGEDDISDAFQDALAAGDFDAAQQALEDLENKLAEGGLTPEEMQQLADELAQMKENLSNDSELRRQLDELASACENAGQQGRSLTKEELETLNQLQQQMGNLGNMESLNMNDEMLRMLGEQSEACQGMLGRMGEDGQPMGMTEGQGSGPSDEEMEAYMSQLESMSEEQAAAMERMNGGSGPNPFGVGGPPGESEVDGMENDPTRMRGDIQPGDITSSQWRHGRQGVDGDAQTEYDESMARASAGYEEALTRDRIPLDRRDLVREYFDRLNQSRADEDDDD